MGFAKRDPSRNRITRIHNRPGPRAGASAKTAKPIGLCEMSPRPHDGTAEEGLSSSLLQIVHDTKKVERLRDVLSGFCHRCRNSLNGIKMSLYLFRREARGAVPQCWGEIEAIYQQVENLFDRLQSIYRPIPIRMVRSPLDELIRAHEPKWRSWFESRGLSLWLERPEFEVPGDFDPAQLGVGLDAMASWRAEVGPAGTVARMTWGVHDGVIEIQWRELVPQDPPDLVEHAGGLVRRDAGSCPRRLDVLALPLLARILASHGGSLTYDWGEGFGVRLRWPQYQAGGVDGVA